MSKLKSYPGFRRYLNNQLVDLNYLTRRKCKANPWFYALSFFICISHFIKLTIQLILTEVNSLSYFIGDITLVAGPSKKQLTLIYFGWYFAGFLGTLNLLRSQYTPKLQKWVHVGIIFENLSNEIHPYSGLPTSFHRHFRRTVLSLFYGAGLGAFLLCFPSYSIYPKQFIVNLIVWNMITTAAGLTILGNVANFGPLYAFQVFLYGKQMTDEKIDLSNQLASKDNQNIKKLTSIVYQSTKSSTLKMKQILEGYHFWSSHNAAFFMAAFNAQSIILYLVFFVEIPGFLRIALIILGFISWFSGLSVHFFLGAYGQQKVSCLNLRKINFNPPFDFK